MHRFRGHHHIVGCTRQRIDGAHSDHTANVKFRIDRFFQSVPPWHWQLTRNVPPGTLFVRAH